MHDHAQYIFIFMIQSHENRSLDVHLDVGTKWHNYSIALPKVLEISYIHTECKDR